MAFGMVVIAFIVTGVLLALASSIVYHIAFGSERTERDMRCLSTRNVDATALDQDERMELMDDAMRDGIATQALAFADRSFGTSETGEDEILYGFAIGYSSSTRHAMPSRQVSFVMDRVPIEDGICFEPRKLDDLVGKLERTVLRENHLALWKEEGDQLIHLTDPLVDSRLPFSQSPEASLV